MQLWAIGEIGGMNDWVRDGVSLIDRQRNSTRTKDIVNSDCLSSLHLVKCE